MRVCECEREREQRSEDDRCIIQRVFCTVFEIACEGILDLVVAGEDALGAAGMFLKSKLSDIVNLLYNY